MYRFRYTDVADLERWPDWYEVDVGELDDVPTDILLDVEEATGYRVMDTDRDSPTSFFGACMRREMKAMLATQFIGVRLAGVDVRWRDFRPKVMHTETERVAEPEGKASGPDSRASSEPSDSAAAASIARPRKAGRRASAS